MAEPKRYQFENKDSHEFVEAYTYNAFTWFVPKLVRRDNEEGVKVEEWVDVLYPWDRFLKVFKPANGSTAEFFCEQMEEIIGEFERRIVDLRGCIEEAKKSLTTM